MGVDVGAGVRVVNGVIVGTGAEVLWRVVVGVTAGVGCTIGVLGRILVLALFSKKNVPGYVAISGGKMTVEFLKVLNISMRHVEQRDTVLLSRHSLSVVSVGDKYGYWVWTGAVDDAESLEEIIKGAVAEGYSGSFVALLRLSHATGCSHARVTWDGPVYASLVAHAW